MYANQEHAEIIRKMTEEFDEVHNLEIIPWYNRVFYLMDPWLISEDNNKLMMKIKLCRFVTSVLGDWCDLFC